MMTVKPRTTTDFLIDTYCATVERLRAQGLSDGQIARVMKRLTEDRPND